MKYLTYQRGKKKQAIGSRETNLSGIRVSLFFPDNQSLQRSRPHDQSEHHTDPQNHWCNLGHTHTNTPQQPIMERAGVVGKKATEITQSSKQSLKHAGIRRKSCGVFEGFHPNAATCIDYNQHVGKTGPAHHTDTIKHRFSHTHNV